MICVKNGWSGKYQTNEFSVIALVDQDARAPTLNKIALYAQKCPCEAFKSCQWSNDIFIKISQLPSNSASRKARLKYFRERICDSQPRSVYCCANGQAPIDKTHLDFLKKGDTFDSPINNSETEERVNIYIQIKSMQYCSESENIMFASVLSQQQQNSLKVSQYHGGSEYVVI